MCCVNVSAASWRPRRAGTSTVAAGVPSCQPRERSRYNISPGQFQFPARSRKRSANCSESPPLERNGMTASSMATRGNLRRQAVKSSAGVSD